MERNFTGNEITFLYFNTEDKEMSMYGYRSDDPVRDAERYYKNLEEMEVDEQERDYIRCDICGEKIFREDDRNPGEPYWDLDDQRICKRCLYDYLSKARRTA